MFSKLTTDAIDALQQAFASARPFRHVSIDQFLLPEIANQLLVDFPAFEKRYAMNEMGQVGGKAVRMDMPTVSDQYAALDQFFQSREFLRTIEAISGIPDLLYDPDYVGGGTHENVHGQGLDPHVDFNILPQRGWHRRLNLIVYLNPRWEASWGGNLELEKDPWEGSDPNKVTVLPIFNRCVLFETNEISWHGFTAIDLPAAERAVTRKSIAIYLYTRKRPAEETVPEHGTVYVPRGLPHDIAPGTTLTDSSFAEVVQCFGRIRTQLKFLYKRELDHADQLRRARLALQEARASGGIPLEGFVVPLAQTMGFWPDGWCATSLRFAFKATRPGQLLALEFWVPKAIKQQSMQFRLNGQSAGTLNANGGTLCKFNLPLSLAAGSTAAIEVESDSAWQPSSIGEGDERALALMIVRALYE